VFRIPATVYQNGLSLLAALAILSATAWAEERQALVKVERLNVRARPSLEAEILGTLSRGDRAPVLDRRPGWIQVAFGKAAGFVADQADYVALVAPLKDPAPEAPLDHLRRQAAAIERQIAAGKAEVAAMGQRERTAVAQLEEIERRLDDARRRLAGLNGDLAELEARMAATRQQLADMRQARQMLASRTGRRLAALYKMYWLGQIQVLAAAPTLHDWLQREDALRHILAADAENLDVLARHRADLEALTATQTAQQQSHAALAAEIQARLEAEARERKERQQLLSAIRGQKSFQLAAIEALTQAAARLDKAMDRLAIPAPPGVPARGQTFETRKGLLSLPVGGKIIHSFGPYRHPQFNVMNFRGGIDIRAERGEPIRAVHPGRIVYAEWFSGYGNMIIIDHGDAYHTVYAHLDALFKESGAAVDGGEVIATVGDSGSLEGALLHFEIRHHGKPIDPSGWLKAG
jgi:septal ring factor EnvC (AmiA/AmiB activator)